MEKEISIGSKKAVADRPITIVCLVLVFSFVAFMSLRPEATLNVVQKMFDYTTAVMGVPIMWFVFVGLFISLYLAFSKHGDIKLGEGAPAYSMFSYIAMMICAALAATAVYYSFVEWSFYYLDPAFVLEPFLRNPRNSRCLTPFFIGD